MIVQTIKSYNKYKIINIRECLSFIIDFYSNYTFTWLIMEVFDCVILFFALCKY